MENVLSLDKKKRMNKRQQELMVERLHVNMVLVRGNSETPAAVNLWKELARDLNILGCARDWKQWQMVWTKWTRKVRAKVRGLQASLKHTGGGKGEDDLTEQEWKIIEIIGQQAKITGQAAIDGFTSQETPLDESREPKSKKLRQDNFTIVKKCCVNLVKKHGRSVTLFDDLAFRELIDLIPMLRSEKLIFTSRYIQSLLDDDKLADVKKHGRSVTLFDDLAFRELIDLIPMLRSEKLIFTCRYIQSLLDDDQLADETMDITTEDLTADDDDDAPPEEIKGEIEPIPCTCGKDTDESMTRHNVECPASSQQTYWNFFEVSLDSATCQICSKTLAWTDITTLREHLQSSHPSVDFVDDDEDFQKGPPSEDGSTNDLEMEEVYLDETVLESEQTASAAKRRRKRANAPLNITGPIARENIAASLQRFKSLDSFGQYVASLMKLIPKDKCIKFQIQFVEQLLQEQAAAG